MTYVLELKLAGDTTVRNALAGIKNSVQSISSAPGNVFASGNSSPTAKVLSDLGKASHVVAGMKKDFQSIGTALAQGSGSGRAWLATAFASKSSSFQALNPHLGAVMQGLQAQLPWRQYNMASRFKTGLMGWALPGVGFPALPHSGSIRGLRDVTGKDLASVLAMGEFNPTGNTIKGLRDVTGSDLAKVAALGTFGAWNKPPILRPGSGASFNPSSIPMIGQYLSTMGLVLLGVEAFRKAIGLATGSINKGYGIYTQSAASGVTPGLYSYRSALANIFGVQGNPNQVFMFGNAVKQVSDRIAQSTRTLAQNSPALAQVAMNAKILKIDFGAFASDVTTRLAPALNIVMAGMDAVIKLFERLAKVPLIRGALNIGTAAMTNWVAGGVAPFGVGKGSLLDSAMKQFSQPQPSSLPILMKQLPGSAWESMGLSIGPNIGNEIVNQIRKSNSYLMHLPMIANALGANNGVPRGGTFGLSTLVNNP